MALCQVLSNVLPTNYRKNLAEKVLFLWNAFREGNCELCSSLPALPVGWWKLTFLIKTKGNSRMHSLDSRMRSSKILQVKVLRNSLEGRAPVGMGNEYLRLSYLLGSFVCLGRGWMKGGGVAFSSSICIWKLELLHRAWIWTICVEFPSLAFQDWRE